MDEQAHLRVLPSHKVMRSDLHLRPTTLIGEQCCLVPRDDVHTVKKNLGDQFHSPEIGQVKHAKSRVGGPPSKNAQTMKFQKYFLGRLSIFPSPGLCLASKFVRDQKDHARCTFYPLVRHVACFLRSKNDRFFSPWRSATVGTIVATVHDPFLFFYSLATIPLTKRMTPGTLHTRWRIETSFKSGPNLQRLARNSP